MATQSEIERLSVVETKVDLIAADIKTINTKLDNLDGKYAAKWVQTAVAFVAGIIISAVLVALIALVVVQPKTETPSTTRSTNTTVNVPAK
jgi:hypothetical protein